MSKHTPGEWQVKDTSICSDEFCIAVIEDDGGYEAPHEQREANASLIAAAPDLLAVLIAVRDGLNSGIPSKYIGALEQIEAAIRKATGE